MKKNKISFDFPHGKIDGIYIEAEKENAPLVVITNGHNGFYNYGMFPHIQESLASNGISSYSYNFSHGGVTGDNDYFDNLELYEKNCMRLETEDLYQVVTHLNENGIKPYRSLFLLSHSLGSIPEIFAAKRLLEEKIEISGIILVSPIDSIDVWSDKQMKEWEENGVMKLRNNRTNQDLPQGKEFYQEIKQAKGKWNFENALKEIDAKLLIVHGEKDEAIPLDVAKKINELAKSHDHSSDIKIIPNATHTFNTKHPFAGTTPELESLIKIVSDWINNNS